MTPRFRKRRSNRNKPRILNSIHMKTPESICRREFLVNAALTAGSVAIINRDWPVLPASVSAAPLTTGAGWFDRPMRWAQLTLVEDDPGKYDPAFWLDYFRR